MHYRSIHCKNSVYVKPIKYYFGTLLSFVTALKILITSLEFTIKGLISNVLLNLSQVSKSIYPG
jgi:hypothetical protein